MVSNSNYINGKWVEGKGNQLKSINPHNKKVLGKVKKANKKQLFKATEKANEQQNKWEEDYSAIERAEFIYDIYEKLKDKVNEYGEVVSKECGKEISEGKADITEAYHMAEFAAGLARSRTDDIVESEISFKNSYVERKPKGVVGSITPWNFPIAIPIWHICIPLVIGNTIVFKPSEETPLCGKKIAEVFDESDLPDGVFNMVQGAGTIGKELSEDNNIDVVEFTGSSEVGWKLNDKLGGRHDKTVACEMGGNNAVIVSNKADMDIALKSAILSSFKTTGQRCVSSGRIIVHEDMYEEFKERFVKTAKNINIGNPLNSDTFMGPMINSEQVKQFEDNNKKIRKSKNANILLDTYNIDKDGFYVSPFIYEVSKDCDLEPVKEEVFGPHVALIKYSGNIENAININNNTEYGLAGSIISEDYREHEKFKNQAELGLAYVNLPCIGAEVQLPFGGVKKSGNGYPSAKGIIDFVTEKMAYTVNNSEDIELAQGLSADIK